MGVSVTRIRQRLRNRREAIGMTQRALADATGTSQSHVSELENGLSGETITIAVLARWAEALGLTLRIELVDRLASPQTGIAARCTAAVNDSPAINDVLSAAPSRLRSGSVAVPQN